MSEPTTPTPEQSGLPGHAPVVTPETAPYWEGLANGVVRLPRCLSCDAVIWYPRSICPHCGSTELEWFDTSGEGSIYSFSIVRKTGGRWGAHTPFVLAYVELDDGPRVMTNIVGVDPDTLACGDRVRPVFDRVDEAYALLRFTPA